MKSFKEFFNEGVVDSQYLLQTGIEENEVLFKLARAAKSPEDLKKILTQNKNKLQDSKKIDFDIINFKEVLAALKEE
jgi:predicted component of type VI protein secretion system